MKKVKLVSFTIICTIIFQMFMPILMDIDWNVVFAEDSGNRWDISKNKDGSVIAELSEDGTLTISGSGEMKDWNYDPTTDWHSSENKVKKVIINDGVTSIGSYAFDGCSSLTNITIPEGVTNIGSHAFRDCSSLTSIEVSENNKDYLSDEGVLYTKDKTKIIKYPEGKQNAEYTILEGVTSIGSYAFRDCSSLTNITIPKGVTSIGKYAFYRCSSLTSITIPEGVTSIGEYAFYGCSSLTNITIPEGVTSIGKYAFYRCSSLTSITIPEGVTSIGEYAFYGCSSLTNITIPEGVTSIGNVAFSECSSLTNITIPEGVTSIGSYAFDGCSSLTSITIPEGVTSIGNSTFYGCSSLTSVTIPEGVTSIGEYAFYGCSSLTSITIPEGVTSIGEYVFSNCASLTNITIPEAVTSISKCAFELCRGLTSIEVSENNKNYLSDEGILYTKDKTKIIKYPEGKQNAEYTILEGVTSIGEYAFSGCISLTNIVIPEGVTSIEEYVFRWCDKLKIYCKSNSYAKKYAEENEISYSIDDEAPTITSVEGNATEWTKNNVTLKITAEDNQSGLASEAYSFDNGQTWQKENTKTYTENANGVIIKVKDALGNIATYDTINIDKILKINITDYEEITKENEKYITKITQNTTIQQLKEKIETNRTIKIYKGEKEITEEEMLVGTGMTMQIENEKYVLVVKGDINGDGKISLVDLANLKLSMVGKTTLSTASTMAGDINGDGKTSLNDLVKLKMYLVGKITI